MTNQIPKQNLQKLNRRVCIAPMMDYTDRFDRYFLRLISKNVVLYTEMVTTQAILRGDAERLLSFDLTEHPLALQLGGSDPQQLARCASIGQDFGYDEVNLNVGCPSERVSSGRFGASLMLEPNLVADCVAAMRNSVQIPITVKCRIGVDELDQYQDLARFVAIVAQAGCEVFIVHARKAWLKGLSPKENREIPPLRYSEVYRLKKDFPALEVIINGGITDYRQIDEHLVHVDGVMIGREAYHNPYILSEIDRRYYNAESHVPTYGQIIDQLENFTAKEVAGGTPLQSITRHVLGLFHGRPGARRWRRFLSENAHRQPADASLIRTAYLLTQSTS